MAMHVSDPEPLLLRADISSERLARVRARMAEYMGAEFEDYVDRALEMTFTLPGYEHLSREMVRPNTHRAMKVVLEVLEGDDAQRFAALFYDIAVQRARQGLSPHTLEKLAEYTERDLRNMAARCLDDVQDLFAAMIIARHVCGAVHSVIIDAFQQAHAEARTEVERLVQQFSAPILRALPGVVLLPVVGAVSPARAAKIEEALLAGVLRYEAHTAIVDITGLVEADASVADQIGRLGAAVRLVGARLSLVGASPAFAKMLTAAGTQLEGVATYGALAEALLTASRRGREAGLPRRGNQSSMESEGA